MLMDIKSASYRMKSNTSKVVTALDVSVVVLSTLSAVLCGLNGYQSTHNLNQIIYEADEFLAIYSNSIKEQVRAYGILGCSIFTISMMLGLDVWTWNRKAQQMNLTNNSAEANIFWYIPFYSLYFILVTFHVHFANSGYGLANRYKYLNLLLTDSLLKNGNKDLELEQNSRNGKINNQFNNSELSDWNATYFKLFHKEGCNTFMPPLTIPMSSVKNISTITKSTNITPWRTSFSAKCKGNKFSNRIDRIAYIHERLGKGVQSVSSAFGIAVVFVLVSCLLHLVGTAYFLFLELMEKKPKFSFLQFMWIGFHCIRLLLIVEPCHVTTVEAKKTVQIVCEIARNCNNPATAYSLTNFWRQLLADRPNFSACGMCNIDRQILTSFSSAICTYLVILIQFQSTTG